MSGKCRWRAKSSKSKRSSPPAAKTTPADALKEAASELIALFRTDFERRYWTIAHEGATIEAALDLGEVSAEMDGEKRTSPISEVELELKSGDESALSTLSAELRGAFPDLQPDDVSKAQRGYRLREQKPDASK